MPRRLNDLAVNSVVKYLAGTEIHSSRTEGSTALCGVHAWQLAMPLCESILCSSNDPSKVFIWTQPEFLFSFDRDILIELSFFVHEVVFSIALAKTIPPLGTHTLILG